MTTSEILTGARTMWELVDRRAQVSADHPMLIAADGETVTFGEFRDRVERVAAGLHGLGITTGSVVSWQLPTRIDTVVLSIALARLGAVQNPIIHLYREREVGFALRQTGAELFVIPATWRNTDFVAIAEGALSGVAAPPTILTTDDGLPEGDPAVLPPPPEGTAPEDAPVRWIYYTSGSTADPKGVQHTDQTLIAGGWGLARALDMGPDDVGSIAFPFAHIAGPDYLVTMLSMGFPAILLEAFSAPDVLPVFRQHGATMVGGSTAFYVAYLGEQRKTPEDPILPTLRLMSGGGAAKPPEVHYEVRDEIGGRGVVHGYGMTEVPDDRQRLAARHRRATGEHRREAGGGRGRAHRDARRPGRRRRRGGRGAGEGPDGLPRLHRPRPRRRGLRRGTATSAPATWAACGPTGT